VAGLEEEIIEVSQLQQSDASSFLKVVNLDDDVDGHFKIEILPQGSHGVVN
jgi:hypothetical protein